MEQKTVWGKNIEVGNATLVFADTYTNRGYDQPGWALPGGDRTSNAEAAQLYCYRMSLLMRGEKPEKSRQK